MKNYFFRTLFIISQHKHATNKRNGKLSLERKILNKKPN